MRHRLVSLTPACFAFIAVAGLAWLGCGSSGSDETSAVPEEAGVRGNRCGDGICGTKETCSSCPKDCGVCSGATASSSSSSSSSSTTSGSGGATTGSSSSSGTGGSSTTSSGSGGSGPTITAASCAQPDVQQAVDSAVDGETVLIPVGTCTWNAGITTSKQIKIVGQTKGGVKLVMGTGITTYDTALFHISTGAAYSTVISNLEFWPGGGAGMYILVDGSISDKPPLIHDNFFSSQDHSFFTFVTYRRYGGGVIYNNTFQSTYTSQQYFGSGGIQIKDDGNGNASWGAPSTMGDADTTGLNNVYIEDNTFTNVGVFDADDGSRVVFRHNVLNDAPMATHGADTSPIGLRHLEIYDNEFHFHSSGTWTLEDINGNPVTGSYPLNLNGWSDWRGGTGVITGNYIDNISSQYWGDKSEFRFQIQQSDRNAGPDACCPEGYACYHQVGRGMNNGAEPLYVWGNTGYTPVISIENSNYGQCPNNPNENNPGYYIQANRDFYKGTAKPGWNRYTYPHPLR